MSNKVLFNKKKPLKEFDQDNGKWPRRDRYKKFRNKKLSDRHYFKKYNEQFRVKSF